MTRDDGDDDGDLIVVVVLCVDDKGNKKKIENSTLSMNESGLLQEQLNCVLGTKRQSKHEMSTMRVSHT